MNNREVPGDVGRHLVTRIVSSYVKHNTLAVNELRMLIASVHQSLSSLVKAPTPTEALTPAVPIRRSVHPEYVVCLECGFRGRTLRRHLRVSHGLDPATYYARWKLPADYPITAPAYSARRSAMAKELGLGRGRSRRAAKSATRRRSRTRESSE
jgi:MucR family transcriptional regulator, transcriptional regulator of exopolysaccharide biosynthesis